MEGSVGALKEHYGVKISASVINNVTREIGKAAKEFNAEVLNPKLSSYEITKLSSGEFWRISAL